MPHLSPNHNYAADECIAQIPQHHIPTAEEKVRASENFDKDVLVAAHMAALHDAYILEMATHPVNEVTIKPSSPTSSIGGLKPSTLKQLKVGKVHRRRVLHGTLCVKTLCTKSHNGLMVVNVFEDEEGKATPIYISNAMEGNGGSVQAQRLYPQDSKVAVKEPYLTRLPDGEIVLLVEKTMDLVFLWVPDYVEEKGSANGGSKESGFFENDRDVPAIERIKDVSMKGGDCSEMGGKDVVAEEREKGANVSLEPKFKDAMDAMKENGSTTTGGSCRGLQDDVNEKVSVDGGKDDVKEKGSVEDVLDGEHSTGQEMNSEDMAGVKGEDKEGELEVLAEVNEQGSRELNSEDVLGMQKGEQDAGSADVEGAQREVSRELSLEDIPTMPNGVQGGGDKQECDALKGGNTIEVEAREVDNGGDKVEALSKDAMKDSEIIQGKLVDADAGETASSLRVKGNVIFARGDFDNAASVYLRGAEKARSEGLKMEGVLCLSNRAEVWLRLCHNQAAFDDAEAALKLLRECDGVNALDLPLAKALFRKGRALMGLHKYEDAMRVLQEVLAKVPADRQLREAAIKCRKHVEHVLKPGKRQRAAANRKKLASPMKQ